MAEGLKRSRHKTPWFWICGITGSKQYGSILDDLNNAIRYHQTTVPMSAFDDTAGMYGLRARIYKETVDLQQAMKELEIAININRHSLIE
ncbi:MAG: hypothetical protein AB1861_11370 [Cyanobacteriota bacterium]